MTVAGKTVGDSTYHVVNRTLAMGGLTVGLMGFVLLLTGAVEPAVGAGFAFAGINLAYFTEWNLICETSCMSE